MRLLGTAENKNCQFNAICYFSLLFTLQQYIESGKYDWQPYCTFDQTSVPHYWKFQSRGDLQNIMQWVWQDKSIYLPQIHCQRLHIDGKKYSLNQSCHFFKNLQHVTFVHTDTIAAFISSGQCLENLFFHFK